MPAQWIQITSHEDRRWRHFLHEVPVVPFSWDPRFLAIAQSVFHYQPHSFLLVNGEQPRAGGVFLVRERLGNAYATAPFFAFYLPILAIEPAIYKRYHDIDTFLQFVEEQFQSVECVTLPGMMLCLPFRWRGCHFKVSASGLLPIENPEKTLMAMEAEERRLVRRAVENDALQIVRAVDLREFYQLLRTVYQRHRKNPPLPLQQFEAFLNQLQMVQLGHVLGVVVKERLVAATVIIPYGNTVHGLLLARQLDALGSQAAMKLIWHVATTYSEAGMEWYDLGGLDVPSIADFKLKIGAQPRMVYRCRFLKNKKTQMLYQLAEIKNKTLRKLR